MGRDFSIFLFEYFVKEQIKIKNSTLFKMKQNKTKIQTFVAGFFTDLGFWHPFHRFSFNDQTTN